MICSQNFLTCRLILFIMVISAFMIHTVLRVNMPIAIVDMGVINSTNSYYLLNEETKQEILGSFYWGFMLTQIPGGRLSETFGTRKVMGFSMLVASVLTIVTPPVSHLHYYGLMGIRVCLGLVLGLQWPSVAPLASRWVGLKHMSKFMATTAVGSLGATIALTLCGYLIASLGWESVFYVTGSAGVLWSMLWFYLVHDFPDEHPRISNQEKEQIRREISQGGSHPGKTEAPWGKILTSMPVWVFVVFVNCILFNFSFIFNEMPIYLNQILNYNIAQNGTLSSLPHVARCISACVFSFLIDRLIKSQKFHSITIRKFFVAVIAMWGSSIIFTIQALYGDSPVITLVVFTAAYAFDGLALAGGLPNCLDISPIYSGTISGLAFAIANGVSYVGTKLVALFTKEKQDFEHWSYIFWIIVAINFVSGAIFLFLATGEIQSWNYYKGNKKTVAPITPTIC